MESFDQPWGRFLVDELLGILSGLNAQEHTAQTAAARLEEIAARLKDVAPADYQELPTPVLSTAIEQTIAAFERAVIQLSNLTGKAPDAIAAELRGGALQCNELN